MHFVKPLPRGGDRAVLFAAFLVLGSLAASSGIADPVVAAEGPGWKAIEIGELTPKEGSPLDFSFRLGNAPAGSKGRVIARPDGRLAFESEPDRPVRFFGCTVDIRMAVPSDPEKIEAYAEAIRRQGYNVVRINFLDADLGGGQWDAPQPTPEALAEFDRLAAAGKPPFNEAMLDRTERFVAALKKRGIYIYLDAMTSWLGYYPVSPWTPGKSTVTNMGYVLFDPNGTGRTHWHNCVKALLTRVNPYTNTSLATDPQVMAILGQNEVCFNFWLSNWKKRYEAVLLAPWREYLQRRYKSVGDWTSEWGSAGVPAGLASLAEAPLFERDDLESPRRGRIVGEFLEPIEANLSSWYQGELRSFGYEGLFTLYDMLYNLRLYVPRAQMGLVSMHGYHDHPLTQDRGAMTNTNTSALADGLSWLRGILGCRISGKPFAITEYGQVFWNRYRYEEGLSVGAYAAFQDVVELHAHSEPVEFKSRALAPFRPGADPVGRASQVVTGILFMDGAITPAAHRVDIGISREQALTSSEMSLPGELTRLSLVTGMGVAPEGTASEVPARWTIPFKKGAETRSDTVFAASVVESGNGKFGSYVGLLKEKGILAPENRTSVEQKRYESENGQILLDAGEKSLIVNTPKVSGAAIASLSSPVDAGALGLEAASVAASVTAAALDKDALTSSGRILLVVATDARNTGDTFSSEDEKMLIKAGLKPILLKTGRFVVTLKRSPGAPALKAWTLGLDGGRRDPIEVEAIDGGVRLRLNTEEWPSGPTPFVELSGSGN